MKDNSHIDELLNSFIDGELTAREQTEAERLIAHDKQIAERLKELQKCKVLVGSLPRQDAPAEMLENIKATLERKTLLEQPVDLQVKAGSMHLLLRKVLAAAAMVGLMAVLAAVVYTIIAPGGGAERTAATQGWRTQSAVRLPAETKIAPAPIRRELSSTGAGPGFEGRLELKTSSWPIVVAFINKAVENNSLSGKLSRKEETDRMTYTLSCSKEDLSLLLTELNNIWAGLDSAMLFVETGQIGKPAVVDNVDTSQIAKIAEQPNLESRVKLTKDFAALNNMAELLPGTEVLAAIGDKGADLLTIPKPALTSNDKKVRSKAAQIRDEDQVSLTIVVTGSAASRR